MRNDLIEHPILLRPARQRDVDGISALINGFAAEGVMLPKTPEAVALALHDFVVAVDRHDRVLACGALREYSPSLAEVASIAVAREAHGQGLGRRIVAEVEQLAAKRGIGEVFALTLEPGFFGALGYAEVDRALYPEKIRRDCVGCARRFRCQEITVQRLLDVAAPLEVAA